MDESKKYIEMCEKAEEIQEIGKEIPILKGDDMFYHPSMDVVEIWCRWLKLEKGEDFLENLIWLPRQDQLQEMWLKHPEIHPDDAKFEEKMDAFIYWLWGNTFKYDYYPSQYDNFSSAEQLWLAFVMKEKHNKTWNGKEWINGT